jgi:hypothetical protein
MPERFAPWTMRTIGEVMDTMAALIREHADVTRDTNIVWYHLQDGNLSGVEHECAHVFNESDDASENWVELTLKDPHRDADGHIEEVTE